MAIVQITSAPTFIGLSADTKPANQAPGARFYATDTGIWYIYDGSAWQVLYGQLSI